MPSPKTPTSEPSVESQARDLIAKFSPTQTRLVASTRTSLRKLLPTATEIVYEYRAWFVISYSPTEHGHQGVLAIWGDADGIKLYFTAGKQLPDPEKLLKGSAAVRFIDLDSASTLTQPAVAALIKAAIAHNKVPFPKSGKGSVFLSASTMKAKKKSGPKKSRLARSG